MLEDSEVTYVGGGTYRFRWDGRRLEYMDRERGPVLSDESADVEIEVSIHRTAARLLCGEVRVSTVLSGDESTRKWQTLNSLGETVDPLHIDSAVWRAFPVGQLVESAMAGVRDVAAKVFEELGDERLGAVAAASPARPRPGPKPSLTPDLLARVVAPAFKAGGRRPVEAVRSALEQSGYQGSGPDGGVTIDQARKAVAKARATDPPLIPPANRRTR